LTLLYWCASSYYSGLGEIVDAGCFLGGSTVALASGLRDNLKVAGKERRIHSFDRFLVDHDTKQRFFQDSPLKVGDSFLSAYEHNIEKHRSHVEIYAGDIRSAAWNAPIEILFLDVIKESSINDVIMTRFFPHLIPGISLVIQQDYIHFALPWIHITMERLAEYFETLDYFRSGSAVYRLKHALPAETLEGFVASPPSADEQIALIDAAIAKVPSESKVMIELSKVILLMQLRRPADAVALFDHLQKANTDPGMRRRILEVKNILVQQEREMLEVRR